METSQLGSVLNRHLKAALGIIDFVLPFEVLMSVGLVFALENVVEAYLVSGEIALLWIQVYVVFAVLTGTARYMTADEEEIEDLEDDLDEFVE